MEREIRRERTVELCQEGFRYDDIIRLKIAEDVLLKDMKGAFIFPDVYGSNFNTTSDGFILIQSASDRHFDSDRDYLYSIPVKNIALSKENPEQNPNW